MRILAALLVVLLLGGCATPKTRYPKASSVDIDTQAMATRSYNLVYRKVADIAYPIFTESVDKCKSRSITQLEYFYLQDYTGQDKEIMRRAFHLENLPQISFVPTRSCYYASGLRNDDEIVKINSTPFSSADKNEMMKWGKGTELLIRHLDGEEEIIVLNCADTERCNVPIRIIDSNEPDAYVANDTIYITAGMLSFVQNDDELALVISHELAHITMDHIDAKTWNSFVGGTIGFAVDVLAGVGGYNSRGYFTDKLSQAGQNYGSQDFEREADYVALYLMAKAGYKVCGAANFWQKMSRLYPQSVEPSLISTHPSSTERYNAMAMTISEIQTKQQQNLLLEPETKK